MENKKRYQIEILRIRDALKNGMVINAYELAGEILEDMEKEEDD